MFFEARRRLSVLVPATLLIAASALAQGLSPLDQPAAKVDPNKPAPPANALDKRDLEFYVRHLHLYEQKVSVRVGDYVESEISGLLKTTVRASLGLASRAHVFYVSKDGSRVLEGSVYEIDKNPFHENNEKIDASSAPGFGKEGASVVLVAYSDFQCSYCATEAKVLRKQLKQEYADRVRVYYREFPLAMHDWARDAAIVGRCIYQQEPDAFWEYHDWIYENQKSITKQNLVDKASEFAASKGVDALKLSPCISSRATEKEVEESIKEGRSLGVTSTPTIFVNGRKLSGSPKWEQLKVILDYELRYQEITHNAGDDCACSIEAEFPKD